MKGRIFSALVVVLLGAALVTSAAAGPRIAGLYRPTFDPLATEAAQALQAGEALSAALPGDLLLIVGQGFTPDATVLFSDREVRPLAPPLSGEERLLVIVPRLRPGETTVAVATAGGRSGGLTLKAVSYTHLTLPTKRIV